MATLTLAGVIVSLRHVHIYRCVNINSCRKSVAECYRAMHPAARYILGETGLVFTVTVDEELRSLCHHQRWPHLYIGDNGCWLIEMALKAPK